MKLAASLSMMFTEVPLPERFGRAAKAGFTGVEVQFPYEEPPEALAGALRGTDLEVVLINLPPGDRQGGERGLAALPGREADFAAGMETALPYALALGARRVHAMAGIPPQDAAPEACRETYLRNLRAAAAFFAPHGIEVLIEPISQHTTPGYYLSRQDDAVAVLERAGAANLGLQMDLYHCQLVEDDLAARIRRNFRWIRHVQIAGVPDRHEPDTGTLDYRPLFDLLDELGYSGWVGCEYRPAGDTVAGLAWARPYLA